MFLIFLIPLPKKNELCCTHLFFQGFEFFPFFIKSGDIFTNDRKEHLVTILHIFTYRPKIVLWIFLPWKRALDFLRPKCRNHCHKCPTFQRIACQWKTGRPPWWAWPQPRRCDYAWHARAQEPHANWTEDSNRILQHWLLMSLDWKFKIQIIFFAKINVKFFTYSDILT